MSRTRWWRLTPLAIVVGVYVFWFGVWWVVWQIDGEDSAPLILITGAFLAFGTLIAVANGIDELCERISQRRRERKRRSPRTGGARG